MIILNENFFLFNNKCIAQCPISFYGVLSSKKCFPCAVSCQLCDNSTDCFRCLDGFFLHEVDKKCYSICPKKFLSSVSKGKCEICPKNCDTCEDATKCSVCSEEFLLLSSDNQC